MPSIKDFVSLDFDESLATVRGGPRASAFNVAPTPDEIHAIYSRGFQGVRPDSISVENRMGFRNMMAAMPRLYDVFPWAKGIGKGKISCPYVAIVQQFPGWGGQDAQARGDCFPLHTRIRMADGSEKNIEQVRVLDIVMTAEGNKRPVTQTMTRFHCGDLVGLHDKLFATPEHPILTNSGYDKIVNLGTLCSCAFWRKSLVGSTLEYIPVGNTNRHYYEGAVFNLEVEDDHSYVANGYGVHNCTVHGTYNACAIDYGIDSIFGEAKFKGPLACENIYRSRGFNGDGWSCEAPCVYVGPDGKGGLLYRQVWSNGSESVDLSKYNPSWEGNGKAGVPSWMEEESKKNKIKWVIPISSAEEYRDVLAMGYGINVCSGQGFSSSTDENGVSKASGSWSHAMAHTACIDTDWARQKYGDMIGGIQQSWGEWNTINGKPEGTPKMPVGMFYSRIKTVLSMISGGDSFAMCGVWGWDRTNWEAFNVGEYKESLLTHLRNSTTQDYYKHRQEKLVEITEAAASTFLSI